MWDVGCRVLTPRLNAIAPFDECLCDQTSVVIQTSGEVFGIAEETWALDDEQLVTQGLEIAKASKQILTRQLEIQDQGSVNCLQYFHCDICIVDLSACSALDPSFLLRYTLGSSRGRFRYSGPCHPLPPTWEIGIEFLSWLVLGPAPAIVAVCGMNQWMREISLYLSLSLR